MKSAWTPWRKTGTPPAGPSPTSSRSSNVCSSFLSPKAASMTRPDAPSWRITMTFSRTQSYIHRCMPDRLPVRWSRYIKCKRPPPRKNGRMTTINNNQTWLSLAKRPRRSWASWQTHSCPLTLWWWREAKAQATTSRCHNLSRLPRSRRLLPWKTRRRNGWGGFDIVCFIDRYIYVNDRSF